MQPAPGTVLSADIAVPDHDEEVRFYSHVLTTGESPLWRKDLSNNHGTPIIGLGAQSPEYAELPLQWMLHIQVESVAESVATALRLGGRELIHAKGDEGESQWAVLLDPNGAAFGLIPPASPPPTPEGPKGHIAWFDLTVPDAVATRDFYQAVVGWGVEETPMGAEGERYSDFTMLAGGEPVGGICHGRGVNTGLPQVWLLYLPVGDLDESVRRAVEAGGTVIKESRGADGALSLAVIRDPVGASFALGTS